MALDPVAEHLSKIVKAIIDKPANAPLLAEIIRREIALAPHLELKAHHILIAAEMKIAARKESR